MKKFIMIATFRIMAVIDIITSDKFELTAYKNGKQTAKTRFDKKEIENNVI